jgi:hypothetical protein
MLGCAIVVPLLLFGAYAGARVTDEQLRLVRNDLMSEARMISAEVDREIIGKIERLQAFAASPSLREGAFAEFQRQAEASLAFRAKAATSSSSTATCGSSSIPRRTRVASTSAEGSRATPSA